MLILLHSSKTMRSPHHANVTDRTPMLAAEANQLARYIQSLSLHQIQDTMKLSTTKAKATYGLLQSWSENHPHSPAIDAFLGDIYSGLQAPSFTPEDREYANAHLYILSGLYGILRALDTIQPYRLEMGYKLPGNAHDLSQPDIASLYEFWGDKIARQLPKGQPIINLSAKEYTKAVFPHFKNIDGLKDVKVVSPKFLTISPKTNQPTFVTVHAKIARGAFARWLIQNRIEDLNDLQKFHELGYVYSPELSTKDEPAFVAKKFQGLGMSVRLTR